MKKWLPIIVMVILSVTLTAVYASVEYTRKENEGIRLAMLNTTYVAGQPLAEEDVSWIFVEGILDPSLYMTDISESIGKKSNVAIHEKALLQANWFEAFEMSPVRKGYAWTSLKLLPEEAVCWEFHIGERLQVVHVIEGDLTLLGTVTVRGLYSQDLKHLTHPIYVLIEGEEKLIYQAIKLRQIGRMELLKIIE